MKIFGSRYEHEPLPGKKIKGCLLRLSLGVWNEGFADLHPWPEFGETPLELQLQELNEGKWSKSLQKSLVFASQDAKARRQNRNLLEGLDLPFTHVLVDPDDSVYVSQKWQEGFRHFKIKMTNATDLSKLPKGSRLRLDFNGSWYEVAPEFKSTIDWIEDPDRGQLPRDFYYSDWVENPSWPGKILKPSRDFSFSKFERHRYKHVAFTHSLNHPIGQIAALWEAARFYRKYPWLKQVCGFGLVETPEFATFNEVWNRSGPRLKPAPGVGFGFDKILEDLSWERIF